MSEEEEHVVLFVRIWAEAVLRQLERFDEAYRKFHTDSRNYERMEDWSPTEDDIERAFRALWAEGHTLVWAAHQLEQWRKRLSGLRKRGGVKEDRNLKNLRDALEHLVEADFTEGAAVPRPEEPKEDGKTKEESRSPNRGLKKLPGRRLEVGPDFLDRDVVKNLESVALGQVAAIENELEQEAVDRYLSLSEALSE